MDHEKELEKELKSIRDKNKTNSNIVKLKEEIRKEKATQRQNDHRILFKVADTTGKLLLRFLKGVGIMLKKSMEAHNKERERERLSKPQRKPFNAFYDSGMKKNQFGGQK